MNENCYANIQFNNHSASVIIVKKIADKIHLLCTKSFLLEGYKNGQIEDINLFEKSIHNLTDSIQEQFKIQMDECIVTFPANHLKIYTADGQIAIKTEGQIISKREIDRVRQECKNVKINDTNDECIVEENPIFYSLDNHRNMRTAPIHYSSSFLKLKSYIYSLPVDFVEKLYQVFSHLNMKMLAGYLQPFLPLELYVEPYGSEDGLCIVDLQAESVNISLFFKEQLIAHRFLNKGYLPCIHSIAETLKIDIETATNYFYAYFVVDKNTATNIELNQSLNVTEKRIHEIVFPILNTLCKEIIEISDELCQQNQLNKSKKLLCGQINDIDNMDILFPNYQLGIYQKVGLLGYQYHNHIAAILRYLHINHDVISTIQEDDNKPSFTLHNQDTTNTENKSKFRDIFEE